MRAEWGESRVEDLADDILALENSVNGFHSLGTPDGVIPDRSNLSLFSHRVAPDFAILSPNF